MDGPGAVVYASAWCTHSGADLIREGIVVNLISRERAAMPAEVERRCLVAISHPSW